MKKKSLQLIIVGIGLILTSCQEKPKEFEITAHVDGFSDNSKVIVSEASSQKLLDSATIVNGRFIINGFLDKPPTLVEMVVLSEDEQESSYTSMFIGNEKITITGNKADFTNGLQVKGSKYNKLKVEFDEKVNPFYDKRNEKLQQMFTLRNEGKWNDSLQSAYWSETGMITHIDNDISHATKQFISENINSDFALSQLVTSKNDFSKEFIQEQLNKLTTEFAETKYAKVLQTYLANKQLEKGEEFYNFKAENQNGESIDFASFFKNDKDFTLLEFCSPHCSWCKKALPEIKKLEKSENDKLQVITYYVDESKGDWLKTTKSNEITWISLWNENGRYSDAYTKYQVSGTPTYYLFDNQGKVLNMWTGYDENMITNIKKLLE